MLSPSESPWLFTYGSLTTGSAWWGVMTCPDFLEYVAFSADESDLCLFWSVLTNSKCSSKTFVCCRIFVVTWHSETFKDMKPQFNQTSAPHRLVLIVVNARSEQVSFTAVLKPGYNFIPVICRSVPSSSVLVPWNENPFAVFPSATSELPHGMTQKCLRFVVLWFCCSLCNAKVTSPEWVETITSVLD